MYSVTAVSVVTLFGMRSTVAREYFNSLLSRVPAWLRREISLRLRWSSSTWPPDPDRLVRVGSRLLVTLTAVCLWLVKRSHDASRMDMQERRWINEELERREEHLTAVVAFASSKIEAEDSNVDIYSVISAAEAVACCDRLNPRVGDAYLVAARGVALKLESLLAQPEVQRGEVDSATVADFQEQLDHHKQILAHLDRFLLRRSPVQHAVGRAVARTRRVLSLRRYSQLVKAFKLMEESASQVPLMAASGVLSIAHGAVEALKVHYMSMVFSQAMRQVGAEVRQERAKEKNTGGAVGAVVVVELLGIVLQFLKDKVNEIGQAEYIRELRVAVFSRLVSQDMEFIEKKDMEEYAYLVLKVDTVCQALWNLPMTTIDMAARVVSSSLLLWSKSRRLAVLMALVLPARLAISVGLQMIRNFVEALSIMVDVRGSFGSTVSALKDRVAFTTLRVFAREPVEIDAYAQKLKTHERYQERGRFLYSVFSPFEGLLDKGVEIIGIWYGSKLTRAGEMDPGDLPSFVDVSYSTFDRVRYLYAHLMSVSEGILEPAERMYDLRKVRPKIRLDYPPISSMEPLKWTIQFHDVVFSYPTRPEAQVLKKLTFSADEGEQLGILGESGCGKSTIFALLLRLYNVDNGEIRIGGKSLLEINPLWLRQRVAVVTQTTYFPYRTVKENLLYGTTHLDPAPTEAAMHKALEMAHCKDLFLDTNRFPQEWHTDIGRNAEKLSGGERQRLSLARALLKEPRLLLLDEATSALDEELQFRVQESIQAYHRKLGGKLTIITIAHRLSNFRHCDKLIVLDHGKVVEEGTPKQLAADSENNPSSVFHKFLQRHKEAI